MTARLHSPDEDDQQIHPHSQVCDPREPLQRPNLSQNEPCRHEDDKARNETNACTAIGALGNLRDRLSVAEDEDRDKEHELQALRKVDGVPRPGPKDAEVQVAVAFQRVPVGVEAEEGLVEDPSRTGSVSSLRGYSTEW